MTVVPSGVELPCFDLARRRGAPAAEAPSVRRLEGPIRILRSWKSVGLAAAVVISAAAFCCVGRTPPDIARVPIPGSTLTLVVTKDALKQLHYGRLFDRETPISEYVILTGYMQEDLSLQRVESSDQEVTIYLSGGQYSIVVKVDTRQKLILSPNYGRWDPSK